MEWELIKERFRELGEKIRNRIKSFWNGLGTDVPNDDKALEAEYPALMQIRENVDGGSSLAGKDNIRTWNQDLAEEGILGSHYRRNEDIGNEDIGKDIENDRG